MYGGNGCCMMQFYMGVWMCVGEYPHQHYVSVDVVICTLCNVCRIVCLF